jgi:hypothetical protein
MLGYLRSRRRKSFEEGRRSAEDCLAACKDVWLELSPPQTTDPAALAEQIELLSVWAFRYMLKHRVTKHFPAHDLWKLVLVSVLDAKTHPKPVVEEAVALLRAKHGRLSPYYAPNTGTDNQRS